MPRNAMCLVQSLTEGLVWLYSEDEIVVFKSTRCMLYTGENPAWTGNGSSERG